MHSHYYESACNATNYSQHMRQVMKKPPETTTMRDYEITAIIKYWATKFISSSTAQYSKTAETL